MDEVAQLLNAMVADGVIAANADTGDVDGVPLCVVGADYLAVIALHVGRAKDLTRVLALLESESVSAQAIEQLSAEHGLSAKWQAFKERFSDV